MLWKKEQMNCFVNFRICVLELFLCGNVNCCDHFDLFMNATLSYEKHAFIWVIWSNQKTSYSVYTMSLLSFFSRWFYCYRIILMMFRCVKYRQRKDIPLSKHFKFRSNVVYVEIYIMVWLCRSLEILLSSYIFKFFYNIM